MTASVAERSVAVTGRPRAVYTRIATLGLVLVALAPLSMVLAAVLADAQPGGDTGFLAVVAAVGALGAALVWRFGRWAKVAAVVIALAAAAAMFWVVFGLAYPASFGDFVPGVLLPVGVALALVGAVAGLVATRRGRVATEATAGERRVIRAVAAVVAVVVVGSAAATLVSRESVAADEAAFTATLADFAFDAETYTVAAGETTAIRVRNDDGFVHTFTIPELGVDETVLPGSDALVEVTAPAGTYTLYCRPHADLSETDPAEAGMAARVVAE